MYFYCLPSLSLFARNCISYFSICHNRRITLRQGILHLKKEGLATELGGLCWFNIHNVKHIIIINSWLVLDIVFIPTIMICRQTRVQGFEGGGSSVHNENVTINQNYLQRRYLNRTNMDRAS